MFQRKIFNWKTFFHLSSLSKNRIKSLNNFYYIYSAQLKYLLQLNQNFKTCYHRWGLQWNVAFLLTYMLKLKSYIDKEGYSIVPFRSRMNRQWVKKQQQQAINSCGTEPLRSHVNRNKNRQAIVSFLCEQFNFTFQKLARGCNRTTVFPCEWGLNC